MAIPTCNSLQKKKKKKKRKNAYSTNTKGYRLFENCFVKFFFTCGFGMMVYTYIQYWHGFSTYQRLQVGLWLCEAATWGQPAFGSWFDQPTPRLSHLAAVIAGFPIDLVCHVGRCIVGNKGKWRAKTLGLFWCGNVKLLMHSVCHLMDYNLCQIAPRILRDIFNHKERTPYGDWTSCKEKSDIMAQVLLLYRQPAI